MNNGKDRLGMKGSGKEIGKRDWNEGAKNEGAKSKDMEE